MVPTTELSLKVEFSGTDYRSTEMWECQMLRSRAIIQSRVIETLRLISGALSPVQEMYYARRSIITRIVSYRKQIARQHVRKNLARVEGVVEPVTIFLTFIAMQKPACHTVCRRYRKICECSELKPHSLV